MRGHNICFLAELTKIIPNYQQILVLIYISACNLLHLLHGSVHICNSLFSLLFANLPSPKKKIANVNF